MGSSNVKVAVVDMGIQPDHPDIVSKIYDSYDCYNRSTPSILFDYSIFPNHGTPVAGIISAAINQDGLVGVSPNCKLMDISFDFVTVTKTMNQHELLSDGIN